MSWRFTTVVCEIIVMHIYAIVKIMTSIVNEFERSAYSISRTVAFGWQHLQSTKSLKRAFAVRIRKDRTNTLILDSLNDLTGQWRSLTMALFDDRPYHLPLQYDMIKNVWRVLKSWWKDVDVDIDIDRRIYVDEDGVYERRPRPLCPPQLITLQFNYLLRFFI